MSRVKPFDKSELSPTVATSRLTIGLPVYNGEEFVGQAIEALLAQTFKDFELIVCDNASTDRTAAIADSYAAKDPRVCVLRNSANIGLARNYNRAARAASGVYFMWTAHDDLWEPDYVERCIEVLDANPDVILACGLSTDIDECGKILPPDIVYREGTIPVDDLAQQGGAHQRFADMIGLEHVCEPIFGVMRLAVLRQTAMHGRFADADRVLLAELALHGRFAVVRKRLFYHREHAHRSMGLYPGRHERSVMMDPENEGKILFPHFKELFEMHLAIQRSPVALGTRLLCYGQLAWWSLRYGRRLFMDLQVASVLIAKRILPMPVQRFLKRILLPQR